VPEGLISILAILQLFAVKCEYFADSLFTFHFIDIRENALNLLGPSFSAARAEQTLTNRAVIIRNGYSKADATHDFQQASKSQNYHQNYPRTIIFRNAYSLPDLFYFPHIQTGLHIFS
jgi:hypothetical protein